MGKKAAQLVRVGVGGYAIAQVVQFCTGFVGAKRPTAQLARLWENLAYNTWGTAHGEEGVMDQDHTTGVVVESPLLEPVYTTEEVGKMLKVSQRTVQDWVKSGALSAVQYGKHLRIRPSDLATFGKVRQPTPPTGAVQE